MLANMDIEAIALKTRHLSTGFFCYLFISNKHHDHPSSSYRRFQRSPAWTWKGPHKRAPGSNSAVVPEGNMNSSGGVLKNCYRKAPCSSSGDVLLNGCGGSRLLDPAAADPCDPGSWIDGGARVVPAPSPSRLSTGPPAPSRDTARDARHDLRRRYVSALAPPLSVANPTSRSAAPSWDPSLGGHVGRDGCDRAPSAPCRRR